MKYILVLLLLSGCTFDRELYYSFNEHQDKGFEFTEDYDLKFKSRSLFIQSKDKVQQHGYSLKNHTFFMKWTFPF